MPETPTAPTTPPSPGLASRGVESGYLPALFTAFAMLIPAALLAGSGASGELRSGLVAYALPMSLAGSKAFAVTFTPLRDWWTRAISSPSIPFVPLLLMAGFLQAWTLMAACVTQVLLQKTMSAVFSGGSFATSPAATGTVGHLQGDLAIWMTTAPALVSLALTLVILLLFRGLSRKLR